MKKTLIYFGLVAFGFNFYSLITWLLSYWKAVAKAEAANHFLGFFPAWFSASAWYLLSYFLTIISIVLLTRYKAAQNHITFTSLIIIQAAFLLLFTWQRL
jgi:hypothetical protein